MATHALTQLSHSVFARLPNFFSAVADALLWAMFSAGRSMGIHYLDDFLFFGKASADECATNLAIALETCKSLGVPVANHKVKFPRTSIIFLGIELDMQRGILRLSLARMRVMLQGWTDKRTCTKRELLSLIGMLQHAASVVKPGRIFLRRLIDLSVVPSGCTIWYG